MRKLYVHDSETYLNYHCHVFKDVALDFYHVFVICDQLGRDDTEKLRAFILANENTSYFIGFNNLNYDWPLLEYTIQKKRSNLEIKKFSDKLIGSGYYNVDDDNIIDLFKIMHFDNRAKRVSLKYLSCVMNSPSIEDLPFPPDRILTVPEMIKLTDYCKNDVRVTQQFFEEVKDKVRFHFQAKTLYGTPSHNYNEVKIGEFISEKQYTSEGLTIPPNPTTYDRIPLKQVILYKPHGFLVKQLVESLESVVLDSELKERGNDFHREVVIGDRVYKMAAGGLHSVDGRCDISSDDEWVLLDRDVGSQYPNAIRLFGIHPAHLDPKWAQDVADTIRERITHKKEMWNKSKTEEERATHAMKSDLLKLSLNGGKYGKLNDKYSWQYDTLAMLKVTINCQLALLDLVEEASSLGIDSSTQYALPSNPKVRVISANTDGILVYIRRDLLGEYDRVCKEWEERTGFELEDTYYERYFARDVNNYLAIKEGGKVKYKGVFEVEKMIGKQKAYHKNFSAKVVAIALQEYIVNGTPVDDTIRNHDNHMDFMIHARAQRTQKNGASSFYLREFDPDKQKVVDTPIGKIVRYYCSTKGSKIYKIFDNGKETDLNVDSYHTLYLNDTGSIKNVNYLYYINQAKKILGEGKEAAYGNIYSNTDL